MQPENSRTLRKRTLRKRTWWEKHGSWAILLLVACSMGQAGFQLASYLLHDAMQAQALAHRQEISALKDEQLKRYDRLLQTERPDAAPGPEERNDEQAEPTARREAEQPR